MVVAARNPKESTEQVKNAHLSRGMKLNSSSGVLVSRQGGQNVSECQQRRKMFSMSLDGRYAISRNCSFLP